MDRRVKPGDDVERMERDATFTLPLQGRVKKASRASEPR